MAQAKKIPQRQCLGCGEMKNKKDMVRIVRTTEGETLIDSTGRKNGRGAYLCRNSQCLDKAQKKKALERSLKAEIPASVYDTLKGELEKIE